MSDNPVSDPMALAAVAKRASKTGHPPIHLWNPPFCGDIDMEIRTDGTWFYQGSPIGRPEMVRLFASILKREGDAYFLVTPVEKVGIRVADAPFIAVDAELGPEITFTTNVGDIVTAGPDHPIEMRGSEDAPRPYLHVRNGLMARIDRKTFYRLAEVAVPDENGRMILHSGGTNFPLEP
ncbi:DUF1285 domain-containing protein [Paracoccus sp. MBLB3053]|uniref:DUF1285 domain-containing protein n=1 Tax=Paracoccus aurantius TaxID=3073814 RepID=A0ABU2HSK8_9RHOB|nr:DUF1285 domain-containing protein [Paracoccus sp. MBLB3053]MDS9467525.1 DUF1285 domain-containing protein [Paracoccus sp. MBLB3053]